MNFQAYKNFGDKVATLKKKLDSLIRDLPETVSSPSADNVPSPGKHEIQGFYVVRLHMIHQMTLALFKIISGSLFMFFDALVGECSMGYQLSINLFMKSL